MPKPNLDDYITVSERISAFYGKHPEGSLQTELLHDDGTRVVVKAYAFRSQDDRNPGIGHAEEVRGEGMVNKTSALENCETSAWGRAIAALGFEVKKEVASREEVEQAIAEESRQKANGKPKNAAVLRERVRTLGVDLDECKMKLTSYGAETLDDLNEQQAWDFEKWLNEKADQLVAAE